MSAAEVRTSPKKARKPQARSMVLRNAILAVAERYDRMSVRQLYYQLVAMGLPKTEAEYKRVCDAALQLRLSGELHYNKIADGARTRQSIQQYDNMSSAMENAHEMYRRNFWLTQPRAVEIWCEKDALTGVIRPPCIQWGVTYVATRGFPSATLRYESAMELRALEKPATIFYFGDHDPSGRTISANLEDELRAHGADVRVVRVALEPEQIADYRLPTRPGKATDSRHAKFAATYGNACVELDALSPRVLVELVNNAITSVMDYGLWQSEKRIEYLEKQTLASLAVQPWEPGRVYRLRPADDGQDAAD